MVPVVGTMVPVVETATVAGAKATAAEDRVPAPCTSYGSTS